MYWRDNNFLIKEKFIFMTCKILSVRSWGLINSAITQPNPDTLSGLPGTSFLLKAKRGGHYD